MPEWRCRLAAPDLFPGRCEGPDHRTCGLRYLPGEYTMAKGGITLPGIGTVRMPGAAFVPKGVAVTVYQDGRHMVAEFDAS